MIKILRPMRNTPLISASVFESLFMRNLGDVLEISPVPLIEFCNEILGPWENPFTYTQAAEKFLQKMKNYNFFCPAYECIALTPLFLALRNTCKSNIRLLFIAHSAGAYGMEWALLRPLLVPGDLIIAPSGCAKKTIEFLCPELSPFIEVIHHPINLLPKPATAPDWNRDDIHIVTLGRIDPSKLIHRQIEAAHILVTRGLKNLRMHIAGSLEDPRTGELSIYARSLKTKIKRLKLENHVFLKGLIKSDLDRAKFLSGATLSLNLSNSIEESFPKASVEPLGLGIPVIACSWNGFVETVGNCGKLVQMTEMVDGFLDVLPEHIADAVEAQQEHPIPAEYCLQQAGKYVPSVVKKKYLEVLSQAVQFIPGKEIQSDPYIQYRGGITDTEGLLGKIACLQPFSWKEMINSHLDYSRKVRASWENHQINETNNEEILRNLVLLSIYTPLSFFYAGKNHPKWTDAIGSSEILFRKGSNLIQRIGEAVKAPTIISSKVAYLYALSKENKPLLLEKCLDSLETHDIPSRTINYYRTEVDYQYGNYAQAYERFIKTNREQLMTSYDSQLMRQIARICRKWDKPGLAVPWLRFWLEKYPDEPDSGSVWLAYAHTRLCMEESDHTGMNSIINTVKTLLGKPPYVNELEQANRLSGCFD